MRVRQPSLEAGVGSAQLRWHRAVLSEVLAVAEWVAPRQSAVSAVAAPLVGAQQWVAAEWVAAGVDNLN